MAKQSTARIVRSAREKLVDPMTAKALRITERIRQQTEDRIAYYVNAGKEAIDRRLLELEGEWDLERCIVLHSGGVSPLSIILDAARSRRWHLASFVASALLLQHTVQGNQPIVNLFRNLGIRTQEEIDFERFSLKFQRGDFKDFQVFDRENQQSASASKVFQVTLS